MGSCSPGPWDAVFGTALSHRRVVLLPLLVSLLQGFQMQGSDARIRKASKASGPAFQVTGSFSSLKTSVLFPFHPDSLSLWRVEA